MLHPLSCGFVKIALMVAKCVFGTDFLFSNFCFSTQIDLIEIMFKVDIVLLFPFKINGKLTAFAIFGPNIGRCNAERGSFLRRN